MGFRSFSLAITALFAATAWGQASAEQSLTRVFHYNQNETPQAMQESANAIRTMPEMAQTSLNKEAKTLTATGTPSQIAMAAWLFAQMDQPQSQATQEYRPEGSVNDVVKILYLTHIQTQQGLQEVLNVVRTLPDMTKVFPFSKRHALMLRGADTQSAVASWLVAQVDLSTTVQTPTPAGQTPAVNQYVVSSAPQHGEIDDVVRVFHLTHALSQQSLQEMVNTLRVIPNLAKVFPVNTSGSIAIRGDSARIAIAAWLFDKWDRDPAQNVQTASAIPPQQFQAPGGADDVAQMYYLAPNSPADSLAEVVNAVKASKGPRIFPSSGLKAVAMRGTATQIAAADVLIKQMTN